VLLPKDYVRLKLTGEKVSDMSDASGTAWLNVGKRDWSDSLLQATGLTRAHMPRLVEGTDPSGSITAAAAEQLQLPRVVVAGGGGDNAASAAGLGVVSPGQASLSWSLTASAQIPTGPHTHFAIACPTAGIRCRSC
jgi:xylulokinase